jgi:hypothetical protein
VLDLGTSEAVSVACGANVAESDPTAYTDDYRMTLTLKMDGMTIKTTHSEDFRGALIDSR